MRSKLQAFEEIIEFHAAKAYLNLGLTKVQYNNNNNNNNNVTGTISELLRQYLCNIPGKHEIKELQKTVILGTARILWKVLM
jgi:hypothetical protein